MYLKAKIWILALPLFLVMAFGAILPFYRHFKSEVDIASVRNLMTSMKISRVRGKVKAPDFRLKELGGRIVQLTDYRGKVVLINFWTTW